MLFTETKFNSIRNKGTKGFVAITYEEKISNLASAVQILNSFPTIVELFLSSKFFGKLQDCWNNSDISYALKHLFINMNTKNRMDIDEFS
jgi:hypothetical protein